MITKEQIEKRAEEIGAQIAKDYEGEEVYLIGTLRGAVMWMADMMKNISNDMEIDFLLSDSASGKVIPIEVKSSKNYTTSSLTDFKKIYKKRIGKSYIIHPKNYSIKENGTICIPPYMTICL